MVSTAAQSERLYEEALREGQVRHALKTALGCCLATALSFFFHLPSGQLAPVFAYLLMTLGMPSPRLNWLVSQLAIVVSALVSALVLVVFGAAPFLYLALTLLWIFTCVLFTNWFSLPATLGAMVSALGIFVFFDGDVGGTLGFYVAYGLNFLIAGFSVAVVHTLLWQLNTRKVFLERVAAVYARLEDQCRDAARRHPSAAAGPAGRHRPGGGGRFGPSRRRPPQGRGGHSARPRHPSIHPASIHPGYSDPDEVPQCAPRQPARRAGRRTGRAGSLSERTTARRRQLRACRSQAGAHPSLTAGGRTRSRLSGGLTGRLLRDVLCEHGEPRSAEQDRPSRSRRAPGRLRLRRRRGFRHEPLARVPPAAGVGVPGRVRRQPGLSETAALRRGRLAGRPGAAVHLPGHDRPGMGILLQRHDALLGPGGCRLQRGRRSRVSVASAAHAPAACVDRRRSAGP